MAFRNYRNGFLLRMIVFTLVVISAVYAWIATAWIITPVFFALVAIGLGYEFYRYSGHQERHMKNFREAIRYRDFSYLRGSTAKGQRHLFDEVMEELRGINAEKEIQFQNLHTIIGELDAGIVCYDSSGSVRLLNNAALHFIGRPHITNIRMLMHSNEPLYRQIETLKGNEQAIFRQPVDGLLQAVSIHCRKITIRGDQLTLLIFQNIKNALDSQELESWQKLISVLTHEIMNSVTPLISLAGMTENAFSETNLERLRNSTISEEEIEELRLGTQIIQNRSRSLLRFVESYRNLAKIPQLKPQDVDLSELAFRVVQLFRPSCIAEKIALCLPEAGGKFVVAADPDLVEQVMINLVKNAIEAVRGREERSVSLSFSLRNGRTRVEIADSGAGMDEATLEHIFVPFFTTKATGSGIGLSLSKQIMRLHGGNIFVQTVPGQGSAFILEF